MANLKIFHAGSDTELTVSTGSRYMITKTYYSTSITTTWGISSTSDTSYDLIRYIPATSTERTIAVKQDLSVNEFVGSNSNFSTLTALAYTTTTINGDTYYVITLPANLHLLLLHMVQTSSSGSTFYYYYGGATTTDNIYDGVPSHWEDANTDLNEMGEISQQGIQKTIGSETYKAVNAMSWTIQQQSKASYKIYTANLTSVRDKKFIIRAKSTSNNIYPCPSVNPSSSNASNYFYCTINTNSGAYLLAPISVKEITYGQEYEFKLPNNANYVVLAADFANLYEAEEVPAWINRALHQRASGSWD